MTTHVQLSLYLSPGELSNLEALADRFQCVPSQGPQTTKPSWRTLVKWIASGKLEVTPAQGKE
jgi:hypothetical protein